MEYGGKIAKALFDAGLAPHHVIHDGDGCYNRAVSNDVPFADSRYKFRLYREWNPIWRWDDVTHLLLWLPVHMYGNAADEWTFTLTKETGEIRLIEVADDDDIPEALCVLALWYKGIRAEDFGYTGHGMRRDFIAQERNAK